MILTENVRKLMENMDAAKNGGKMTTRDLWNIAEHEPLKVVVVNKRHVDNDIFDAGYVIAAQRGVKLSCERSKVKKWYVSADEDPCRYCRIDNKEECDRTTLKAVEEGILLLDTLPPQYEGDEA